MDQDSLKEYLSQPYKGYKSFVEEIITPLFGDDFEDCYGTELLNLKPELRPLAEQIGISSIKMVGEMFIKIEHFHVFDITVADRVHMSRNRVNVQRIIRQAMDVFSSAFMLFHYEDSSNWDWRFSFCRKGENSNEETDSKRYTFLLGPGQSCRTAAENFTKLFANKDNLSVDDIVKAFDVEALSKEFFEKYKAHYLRFVSYIIKGKYSVPNGKKMVEVSVDHSMYEDFGRNDKCVRDYVKKMMGRITFLHFLQKKGWMGVPKGEEWGKGDREFMRNLFIYASDEQKDDFLDLVLEPIFNEALDTDRKDADYLFNTHVALPQGSEVRIPYLNGGLFVRDEFDEIDTRFPRELFANLLDFFYQYNFTIDENDPDDAQVGVDPEMLGRIFENLLEDNKDKGAFYTPKEIVRYMCAESLTAYLQTDLGKEKAEAVRDFVSTHNPEVLSADLQPLVAKKLAEVKICDPAIGSGAFPMGLLKELFLCRMALEENPDPARAAEIKRQIIQGSIYGVDIEQGAVDIARLRFWLSLIVDEVSPDTLPNLDFKIMHGNSLLESYKGVDLSKLTDVDINKRKDDFLPGLFDDEYLRAAKNLRILLDGYFQCENHTTKRQLLESITRVVERQLKSQNFDAKLVDEIIGLNLLGNDQFFLWHTWFSDVFNRPSDRNGFDIVIGNPPYVSTKGVSEKAKKQYEVDFGFSDDLYNLFTFKGLSLCKINGVLSYITPKTFWTIQTKRNMRDLLLSNTIDYVFDTSNPFDAVMVDACVTQVRKCAPKVKHRVRFIDGSKSLSSPIEYPAVLQSVYANAQNAVIFKPTEVNMRVYELYNDSIKTLYAKWWDKIKTSRDIEKNRKELEAYRASLKPGDITLLGCLTEGGQGLATANNGKYVAIRRSTKWAASIIESRPKKLAEAVKKNKITVEGLSDFDSEKSFLASKSEAEIAFLFDSLKEQYGRDIFGQGYIYKIIEDSELADVNTLTDDEKENGIDPAKNVYVPYDKGDKDGNRWYLETPFAIAWSKENVQFLKTDPKARFQGYTFYFREGFCWIDVNSTYLKARLKSIGVFDVLSMSLFSLTQYPDWYYVSLINSSFISEYVDSFINNTSHFQINDARQLPIIIPDEHMLSKLSLLFESAVSVQKKRFSLAISTEETENELNKTQGLLDSIIRDLYQL